MRRAAQSRAICEKIYEAKKMDRMKLPGRKEEVQYRTTMMMNILRNEMESRGTWSSYSLVGPYRDVDSASTRSVEHLLGPCLSTKQISCPAPNML